MALHFPVYPVSYLPKKKWVDDLHPTSQAVSRIYINRSCHTPIYLDGFNPALKKNISPNEEIIFNVKKNISNILLKATSFSTTKIPMKPSSPSEPNPSIRGDMLPHHHRLKPPPPHDVESEVVYSDDGYLWTRILREVFRTAISAGFGVLGGASPIWRNK